jgi:uncharacterized protein (DUF58 family)
MYPSPKLVALALLPAALAVASLALPWLAGAAWGALAVVVGLCLLDVRASRSRPAPTLERELGGRARLGRACSVRYRVRVAAQTSLTLLDELPPDLGGDYAPAALSLPEGETVHEHTVVPRRRGERALGPIYAFTPSALGLLVRRHTFAPAQVLHVYPAEPATGRGGLVSRSVLRQLGIRPLRPRGEGSDFESLREYGPDDDPRRIDWRASARTRQPVVRNYHTERNHNLVIAVDCGRLMGTHVDGQSKLDHALTAALGLVHASASCQDRVGFVAFDRELCAWVPPQRASAALGPILEATLGLEPRSHETSFRVLADALQRRQQKRSLIVLLSDFVEGASSVELEAYLASLSSRHCLLLVGLRDRLLRELEHAPEQPSAHQVFRRLALQDLDVARHQAMARIARLGVHTLDLDPAAITGPVLDRYLQIREAGLL